MNINKYLKYVTKTLLNSLYNHLNCVKRFILVRIKKKKNP